MTFDASETLGWLDGYLSDKHDLNAEQTKTVKDTIAAWVRERHRPSTQGLLQQQMAANQGGWQR